LVITDRTIIFKYKKNIKLSYNLLLSYNKVVFTRKLLRLPQITPTIIKKENITLNLDIVESENL